MICPVFLFRCDIEKLKTQENIFCAIAERQSIQSNIMKQDDPLAYKLTKIKTSKPSIWTLAHAALARAAGDGYCFA